MTVRYVTTSRASILTGLSVKSMEHMRTKGVWAEGAHYRVRNGRIFIDLAAYERWVEMGTRFGLGSCWAASGSTEPIGGERPQR